MNILSIDIGGTYTKYGIWSNDSIIEPSKFNTPNSLDDLKIELCKIKKEVEDKKYKLDGVAFSCPGVVNKEMRVIQSMSMVPYIHNNNIYDFFEDIFKLPISIENDANCVALAEIWKGNAVNNKNVLFLTIGTGIGGAVVWDGKLQKGKNLHCGEFGFMFIEKDKIFSQLATATVMAKRYSLKKQKDENYFTGEDIFKFAEAGDIDAKNEIENLYHYLSIGIWNLQYIFDPEKIIIGGGITVRENFIEELKIRVDNIFNNINLKDNIPVIESCYYKNHSNLVGAVANFIYEFGKK